MWYDSKLHFVCTPTHMGIEYWKCNCVLYENSTDLVVLLGPDEDQISMTQLLSYPI